jgi:signal transduction histidine kinase
MIETPPQQQPQNRRVLLVDDDHEDCLITRETLEDVPGTRYSVAWAKTYDEALNALLTGPFDVCLLDHRLGAKTGLMLLQEAQNAGCETPVIMLTGVGDPEMDLAAMAAGAADYLVKGRFDARLLEHTIRYAINHKRSELLLKRNAQALAEKNRELLVVQEQLAAKNEELLRLNQEKNRFLGMAAHDLRSPLGVILGYSDFLLAVRGPFMQRSDLDIIEKIRASSHFMMQLLNELLDISTIESGQLHLSLQSTDVIEMVEANADLNRVLASRKGMRIEVIAGAAVPRASVDGRKVEQVLNNLISNAIHYAQPDTRIEVSVQAREGEVVIAVKDEGPGIAPEDIGKLWKPFGRTKNVSTGGEKSTGLGLAIARRIVDAHGGRIWVESELGRGSTFFVAFRAEGDADPNF